jgi:phosphoribosylformylglycinamidine cyclo-ligase
VSENKKITYKDAGVDVARGYSAVALMKDYAKETFDENVLTGIGSFGSMYALGEDVLISGTDGVGTKLKIAFALDKHDTVGIDCVAMCVNDIVCHGAKPLFFLDYIATGRLEPEKAADIVKGIAEGCKQASCALVGGETAEMPDFYADGEYDMAGFATGIVKRDALITGEAIAEGNTLIGLKSSGIHSNGFSLVRRVFDLGKEALMAYEPRLEKTVGEALLTPTKIYVKTVLKTAEQFQLNGIAHITGGSFLEKLARIFAEDLCAVIETDSYETPEIFKMLLERTYLSKEEAYNTFNMGIGMVLVVAENDADAVVSFINENTDDEALKIGYVKRGKEGVEIQ